MREIIASTPDDRLIDHKFVFRSPVPTFISQRRGSRSSGALHTPFLPTSDQGAGQSVEDGVVVATCLELSVREDIPLTVRP